MRAAGGCLVLAAALLAGPAAHAGMWMGLVTHVTDGDTVWVHPEGVGARPLKLRLDGIDAPERCQAWGPNAKAALAAHVLYRHVTVESWATDDHGRLLGRMKLGDEDVGAWMVLQGHAWSYRYLRSAGPYAEQEARARAGGHGLFANAAAQEPRWFRREHGPCE